MVEMLLKSFFDGLTGNKVRRSKRPREVSYGDVVCVEGGLLKRYGIWTGEKQTLSALALRGRFRRSEAEGNFILYGEDSRGKNIVHEETFRGFLGGVEHFAICEFSEKYGRPTEWEQPSPISSVVMPQDKLWRMLEQGQKARKYRRYSPQETVHRARSKLGQGGYLTSEHFAIWCKTGIAESHELASVRDFWDRMIVY